MHPPQLPVFPVDVTNHVKPHETVQSTPLYAKGAYARSQNPPSLQRSPWFQCLSASSVVTSESKFISGVHRIWFPSLTGSLQDEVPLCSTWLQLEQQITDWTCLCCLLVLHKSPAPTRNKGNCTQGRAGTRDEHQNRQNSWGGEQAVSLPVKQCLEPQFSKYRVREEHASKSL